MTTPPSTTSSTVADSAELTYPVTERDMLGAMEILAAVTDDPDDLLVLSDEELMGLDGTSALALLGSPFLDQDAVDLESASVTAVRSLAARRLVAPRADSSESEGELITGSGDLRPFQLDRRLAGVITLRRIPEAMVTIARTLNGGTTNLGYYLFPASGVLEEYVTVDGFHHFSVPPLGEVADRIARFVDTFDDAHEDGEIEQVTVPGPELEQRFADARSLSILTAMVEGEGEQATFCAVPGHLLVLDNGRITEDGAPRRAPLVEVSPDRLRTVIDALIPRAEDPAEERDDDTSADDPSAPEPSSAD